MFNFYKLFTPKKLILSDFKEIKFIINDDFNKVVNGNIWLCYFEKSFVPIFDPEHIKTRNEIEKIIYQDWIGYISYKIKTGQIGLFFIKEPYKNRGLGKQILDKVILDLKSNNNQTVWAVTTDDHPFWSNVYNKSFEFQRPAHSSVTGSGYSLKLV